ncbi:class I SAM-dependent methyltransferase [Halopseudomonas bauzanensis]|uniref:class I SAM-dependent methyltransferase n=1 Tax=Halopseudomonas bauzanensis TaxID=653930 RepID=UPI0025536400|nr:class I SAM-dependent methyltransferase [Halopseudomonas bauzanensis]
MQADQSKLSAEQPDAAVASENVASANDVTILDANLSGWFLESGELFTDFPIQPEDHVLDVGCGDGGFIGFCAGRGAEVTFVDIDEQKVKETGRRLRDSPARGTHGVVSDAAPLPLPDNHVNKVICTEVLEHVDDPVNFLAELVRVGKPGALYLLSVPDIASETVQQKVAPSLYFEKPHHIRIFSREDFLRLVGDAGLIIEKQTCYGFFWSMFWAFFWTCDQDLSAPWHPLLQQWGRTWQTLLSMRDGPRIKQALDQALPKSQVIIARKPE